MSFTSLRIAFVIFLSCIFSLAVHAQGPQWQWATGVSGNDVCIGRSVSVSSTGNIFVAGIYENTPITLGSTTLNNNGLADIFVARYDAAGNVLWAKQAGGSGEEYITASTTDNLGNVIVAGGYRSSSINFGTYTCYNPAPGQLMAFVAKYDANGQVLWASAATGDSLNIISGISVDENNNIYLTGTTFSTTFSIGFTSITHQGYFAAKYNTAGNIVWVKTIAEAGSSYGYGIRADRQGHVYTTGQFRTATASFGSTVLSHAGTSDNMFVAKYDTSGNVVWAKGAAGSEYTSGMSISTDNDGNVIAGGQYSGVGVDLGTGAMPYTPYEVNGFLAKYDKDGSIKWAKSIRGMWQLVTHVEADNNGDVYSTWFSRGQSISFAPIVLQNPTSANEGFIAKYTSSGNVLWVRAISSIGDDRAQGCAVAPDGNIYVTGTNSGDLTLGATTLAASGTLGFYLAKLSNSATGISIIDQRKTAAIYPNPNDGSFIISGAQRGAILHITNMLGEAVHDGMITNDNQRVSLPGVSKGLYFYQLINDAQVISSGKIIVE